MVGGGPSAVNLNDTAQPGSQLHCDPGILEYRVS
jgi:hypothetical protein